MTPPPTPAYSCAFNGQCSSSGSNNNNNVTFTTRTTTSRSILATTTTAQLRRLLLRNAVPPDKMSSGCSSSDSNSNSNNDSNNDTSNIDNDHVDGDAIAIAVTVADADAADDATELARATAAAAADGGDADATSEGSVSLSANIKCNDMECSLVLGDYANAGFLGSFLSKGLKTNQLVVNTDEKTLRPIARLKEPRDLFALPKDKDNDCSQQAPRWPVECQVIEERITHIPYVPSQPEPLNAPTGNELKPRPVGEENGIVVFTYSPISAVNYEKGKNKSQNDESSDESDDSSDNDSTPPSGGTPLRHAKNRLKNTVSKMINSLDNRSTSNSQEEDNDDEDDDDTSYDFNEGQNEERDKAIIKDLIESKKKRYDAAKQETPQAGSSKAGSQDASEIENIWKNNTDEYKPASPRYVLSQFGKNVSKVLIDKLIDHGEPGAGAGASTTSNKVANKFAVTPIKLPKNNLARLELAFEQSARQRCSEALTAAAALAAVPGQNGTTSETDEDGGTVDSFDELATDADAITDIEMCICGDHPRLAGGAEKRCVRDSSSVSESETLVGVEGIIGGTQLQANQAAAARAAANAVAVAAANAAAAARQGGISKSTPAQTPMEKLLRRSIASYAGSPRAAAAAAFTTSPKPHVHAVTMAAAAAAAAAAVAAGKARQRGGDFDSPDSNSNSNDSNSNSNECLTSTSTSTSKLDSETSQETTNEDTTSQTGCSGISQFQFSRSAVGGAKFVTNCHPMNAEEYDGLEFESRFESGNLAKAVQITPTYYELYLRPDLYTSRSKQWFYFRVRRTRRNMLYRFSIVNLVKSDSLYNDGMRPVMYSVLGAKDKSEGWRRCGDNICYYRNDDDSTNNPNEEDEDNSSYTLTFTVEFEHDDDTVYFAHSYPYTYSDLQDYLMEIQRHPVKSKFCKLRLLCRTLAGNNVYYLTVTAPSANEENMRRKKSIVVSARVHPSETPASWMMKGLMDFITGDTTVAKRLRHKFIFKLVPMLNPDGVIVGNTRNSLTGKDLNRQYRTVIRETYPSIWYTKAMIRRLIEECGVAMYCDMHAHSRKHNIFIYGCENKRNPEKKLTEQVFPLMLHKNSADRFSFESCKFKIQRSKEGTGRIVVWMLGITNSYTIEASFGGSSLGSRKGTHFNTHILNLLKQQERLRSKIIERLMREGSSADEPLNIPLSDYSSDEGNCSSSSDNEGKHSITASDLEGPCCAPIRAPPSSPEVIHEIRKFRMRRMRKVMHELDRIYFTPLFQRKFKALTRLKRRRHKLGGKSSKRLRGGGVEEMEARVRAQTRPAKARKPTAGKLNIKQQHAQASSESSELSGSSSQSAEDVANPPATTPVAAEVKFHEKRSKGGKSVSSGSKKKKKKYMPTEKAKPPPPQKLRIDRNFRLWLANRRIYICRRKNKARRTRMRNKLPKKRAEVVRTTLDLPTTDPGSDLHFSTDDEEHAGAVPPLRHTLLQSELQRRYIEEIGDTVVQKPKPAPMPPELIVTTPSKSGGAKKLDVYKLTPRTAPEVDYYGVSGTVPALGKAAGGGGGARRTYSWHNLDQESASQASGGKQNFYMNQLKLQKPPPKRTVPNNFIPMAQQKHGLVSTPDELQLKLSLKKKIWTGAHGEMDGRPLATAAAHWYKGGAGGKGSAGAGGGGGGGGQTRTFYTSNSSAKETPQAPQPPAYLGAPRKPKKLEQVDLLNACSQKLLLWQQEEVRKGSVQPGARLVGGTIKAEEPLLRAYKPLMVSSKKSGNSAKSNGFELSNNMQQQQLSIGKGKRKSSSMMKIAETTQLVTRFARTRGQGGVTSASAGASMQQQLAQRLAYKSQGGQGGGGGGGGGRQHSAGHSMLQNPYQQQPLYQLTQQANGRGPNKFKTGGLVITAVQQPQQLVGGGGGGGSRRQRQAAGSHLKGGSVGAAEGLLQYRASSTSVQVSKSTTGLTLDTVNLVRKVKTKLKKRKSRTMTSAAAK